MGAFVGPFININVSPEREKVGQGYPLSPPLVKPDTKFFCRKKNRILIGRAIRMAPAKVGNLHVFHITDEGLKADSYSIEFFSRSKNLDRM